MTHSTSSSSTTANREQLRQKLLKLIVKNESQRRDQEKAPSK
jgi:hypothetical protein